MEKTHERLMEIRRRLGPYTALQDDRYPHRLNDAEIARRLCELIEIVDELAAEVRGEERRAPTLSTPVRERDVDWLDVLKVSK